MLQPELRAAVVLRDVAGLSSREAAEALDITVVVAEIPPAPRPCAAAPASRRIRA